MIIKKKTIMLVSLILLLFVVGYINHQLTKQSLLQTSNDYQEYEMNTLEEANALYMDDTVETISEQNEVEKYESEDIVDSKENEITDITTETNVMIEETISKEKSFASTNYFVEYRLSRDKLRAELIERLNDIINNDKTGEPIRTEAQKEILRIGDLAERELYIEGLIKAKGFEDALMFLQEDRARVVVSRDELTEQDVVKILEIVKGETGLETSNIKIMKKF